MTKAMVYIRGSLVDKIKNHIRFFVVDVARTESGEWVVVELNDGQQSGLSENDPDVLYSNLKLVLDGHKPRPF